MKKLWANMHVVTIFGFLVSSDVISEPLSTLRQDANNLTPKHRITLQPVEVEIPSQFGNISQDLTLNLPPGFTVNVFSGHDLNKPRLMAFDYREILHVADMNNRRVVALPDRDGNGVADEMITVASGFKRAHSIAFSGSTMYVADRHQVLRYRDVDGDGGYRERMVFADDIPSTGSHSTRTIVVDELNKKVYLSVGWPCDMCRNNEPERGVVLEFNMDGSGRRVFASGVRNVVGMALHPETNQLWGTNNGHDKEGGQIPPEWVDIIREDGFYGVPFAYGYQNFIDFSIPDYAKNLPLTRNDSLLVSTMKPPVALLPAHTAPMGIHFYREDLFPKRFKNTAFVALHAGHAKLAPSPGYKIITLFSDPDGSNVYREDFVTGFQRGTEIDDVWGYPVGITADSEGRMYVSIDKNTHAILRIDHSPIIAKVKTSLPDSIRAGSKVNVEADVLIERSVSNVLETIVEADLSSIGGPDSASLVETEPSHFRLSESFDTFGDGGAKTIVIYVSQRTENEEYRTRIPRNTLLLPVQKLSDYWIYADEISEEWSVRNKTWVENLPQDLDEDKIVYSGQRAASFRGVDGDWDWNVRFGALSPFNISGYDWLSFAINIDGITSPRQKDTYFSLYMGETLLNLFEAGLIDTSLSGWQRIDVKLNRFNLRSNLSQINFSGNFRGKFYLDEIKFRSEEINTAIEKNPNSISRSFELSNNFPNPFNSNTVISYDIKSDSHVSIAIYNVKGQRVAQLVKSTRRAGRYTSKWDGRDEKGNELATGVYLCQMRISSLGLRPNKMQHSQTRKMLLVR